MPDEFDLHVADARYWRDKLKELVPGGDSPPKKTKEITEANRAYFGALSKCLKPNAQHVGLLPIPMRPLPPDLAGGLHILLSYFASGSIPVPVLHVVDNRPLDGPTKKRDMQVAVAYMDAAKQKKISDRTPVVTVKGAYKTDRRTLQSWKKKHPAPDDIRNLFGDDQQRNLEILSAAGSRYALNRAHKR